MAVKLKPLSKQVIVITGASSGFGAETALMAARRGAKVVLAARSGAALQEIAQEIIAGGGEALVVATDVAQRSDLERLARLAVERFGRIDTWVNNAGVGIWGTLEQVPEEDMRQLFEVNFWGLVNGSMVAIPHLEAAGGGALINMGSVGSDRAIPLQGIYSASKHAVKGFTDALRMELEHRGAPISVTLIKPWSSGTPLPDKVRNYTGRRPKLPPPVTDPSRVARAILNAAQHPVRDSFISANAPLTVGLANVAPRLMDRISETVMFEAQLGEETANSPGNLREGGGEARVRGEDGSKRPTAPIAEAAMNSPVTASVVAATVLGSLGYLVLRRR